MKSCDAATLPRPAKKDPNLLCTNEGIQQRVQQNLKEQTEYRKEDLTIIQTDILTSAMSFS